MRRFYAPKENIKETAITLGADETRHLRDVLRLQAGDEARVFDGEGREYSCVIDSVEKKAAILTITGDVEPASPESGLDLTLGVALLKGEKFDLVIQKAVELGATALVPMLTARCDVKLKDASKKVERWKKIALEAAKQSGRARLMSVGVPVDLGTFLNGSHETDLVLFSERGGEYFSKIKAGKKITALFGPEGGWDDVELENARKNGCTIITLGGRILRAETASISIAAILQHRFGDMS